MPTSEVITYDLEELKAMSAKDLQVQQLARMDLDRPLREDELNASALAESVIAATKKHIEEVASLGIPALDQALSDALATYARAVDQ